MNVDISFFKRIYSEDILYHYTKASTAINFILFNGQLRFNASRNSNDPIESRKARRGTVYFGEMADGVIGRKTTLDSNYLLEYISHLENQFHQICFCKNHMGEPFASENYYSGFNGHEEIFGFTKLRMWEQYADNYSGVCLAFSKEKLISQNEEKIELLIGDVEYLTFQELSVAKIGDIQGNHLRKVGRDNYKELIDKKVKQSFFLKHKDYSSENEYRIGTLYDKNKCCLESTRGELVFDRTIMLDISNCIEAIFISSYANDKQKSELLTYANNLNVPIIEMRWQYNSFEPRDYRGWMEFIGEIKLEQLNKED
ncbi:DUF2971 domain-containing protein [Maribellus sp. CM-23]|uniref:DUF2971 domain-containing protein n=1 Tax=Maribellus sp. CM-23 TaxID=2781026 RepID=UPI001F46AB0B|nr:DUF2971 domain-containing protein [Maribellus sp. CM-23]MCE4566588.1 DUF2971 domain-containing protein [Maribellus sp. CM-23]